MPGWGVLGAPRLQQVRCGVVSAAGGAAGTQHPTPQPTPAWVAGMQASASACARSSPTSPPTSGRTRSGCAAAAPTSAATRYSPQHGSGATQHSSFSKAGRVPANKLAPSDAVSLKAAPCTCPASLPGSAWPRSSLPWTTPAPWRSAGAARSRSRRWRSCAAPCRGACGSHARMCMPSMRRACVHARVCAVCAPNALARPTPALSTSTTRPLCPNPWPPLLVDGRPMVLGAAPCRLEVGQIGVLKFGGPQGAVPLHPLTTPFTDSAGPGVMSALRFDQVSPHRARLQVHTGTGTGAAQVQVRMYRYRYRWGRVQGAGMTHF